VSIGWSLWSVTKSVTSSPATTSSRW